MKQNGKSSVDNIFVHVYKRLKSETPKLFNRIFYFMSTLTGLGVALVGYNESLPEILKPLGGYCIAIGTIGAFLAKLPTTDPTIGEVKKEKEG